jgi:hypothetical protein
MGTKNYLYKAILFISLTAINPAYAGEVSAPVPLHFIGKYDFNWTGIPLGTLVLAVDENPGDYKMHLAVTSGGVVNLFTRHVNDTVASGKMVNGAYLPQHYESYYKTKHKPRHIKLEFDSKGAITEELVVPPEDRNERPEVPHNLKDGAYDPLTALLVFRSGNKDFKGFDVKRLYQVKIRESDTEDLYIEKEWRHAISYVLSRKPLSGLTQKEMTEYNLGEPPLIFYFSNNKERIPLAVKMRVMLGYVKGTLVKECKTWQECGLEVNAK